MDGDGAAPGRRMPVDAVDRGVQFPADEPPAGGTVGLEDGRRSVVPGEVSSGV